MLVYYRKQNGWEKTGNILPTETQVSLSWDSEDPRGCFTYPEAIQIVEDFIASGSLEHYRAEIGPASAKEIKRVHAEKRKAARNA
jgi:hypothetical protein